MEVSWREVLRTGDAIAIQLAAGVLRDAGLDARIRGTLSGAAIGVGEQILDKRLEVPASQEARARALIERVLSTSDEQDEVGDDEQDDEYADALEPDEDDEDFAQPEDDEARPATRRMRHPVLRWAVAAVIVGPVLAGIAYVLSAMVQDALR